MYFLGLPVIVPDEEESVLLGGAILGATAAGLYPSVQVRGIMVKSHHSTRGAILGATAAGLYPSIQVRGIMGKSHHSTRGAILGTMAAGLYPSVQVGGIMGNSHHSTMGCNIRGHCSWAVSLSTGGGPAG